MFAHYLGKLENYSGCSFRWRLCIPDFTVHLTRYVAV